MKPDDKVAKNKPPLKQGDVYYMRHRKVKSLEPHFHVVLNKAPLADEEIYTAIITSKVEKRRRCCPKGTLVEFDPSDYPELSKHSAIDCNSLVITYRDVFKMDIRYRSSARPCKPFPRLLLEKVIAGIIKSDAVEPYIKRLIR